jgi:sodium-dependent dicarboxylate transporter 2/3/5
VATVGLWLTDALHGLPAAVVALLPAVAFTAPGLLGRADFNTLEWHILVLIAGGIALGVGMQATGLDTVLVGAIPESGRFALMPLVLATVLLSTLMSNTGAANLLLPVGLALAASSVALGAAETGIAIALAASAAMALPVSTPPNAIAYAQGELESKDFALPGMAAAVLLVLLTRPVVAFWIG